MAEWVPEFLLGGGSYTPQQFRYMLQDTGSLGEGVNHFGDLIVTQKGTGANKSVDVAPGTGWVQGDDSARQGLYHVVNDATVNVVLPDNTSGQARTDRIVCYVWDSQAQPSNGGLNKAQITYVEGTPGAGTPTLPPTALPLATVAVATGYTSITNANITDNRAFAQASWSRHAAMPRVALWHSVDQSVGNSPSASPFPGLRLAFNSNRYDIGDGGATNVFHSNTTNNSRITFPYQGVYLVTFNGRWAANSTGERSAVILINGTGNVIANDERKANTGGVLFTTHTLALMRPFFAGDYIEVGVTQDSGGALSFQSIGSPHEYSPEFRATMLFPY